MLPKNLLINYIRQKKIFPYKLSVNAVNLELSTQLIHFFQTSIGNHRYEIEKGIKEFQAPAISLKVLQGLTKIMSDLCTFSVSSTKDPLELRDQVFTLSAKYWAKQSNQSLPYQTHKKSILEQMPNLPPQALDHTEAWLYSDIQSNQKLLEFSPLKPEQLLDRFNISQVQGLLLDAGKLEVTLCLKKEIALRQLFQMIKFFQLMFQVESLSDQKITLNIDGPSSILENHRAYGIGLANFFPATLLLEGDWQLKASIKPSGQLKTYDLIINPKSNYQTHYKKNNVWHNEKVMLFTKRFQQKYPQYQIGLNNKIIPLSRNRYLLPDFSIKTPQNKQLDIEWIPFISPYKIEWIKSVSSELPKNYILALKSKGEKLNPIKKQLGNQILTYPNEFTVTALKKLISS